MLIDTANTDILLLSINHPALQALCDNYMNVGELHHNKCGMAVAQSCRGKLCDANIQASQLALGKLFVFNLAS